MPVVKQKNIKAVTTNNARAITSIIVPLREKNRPPQQSIVNFRNRTITMYLYPNVFCPISELPKTMHHIIQIWRNILNCDIRYQQKQDNLPSYLGVRDTCVKFSSPELLTDADRLAFSDEYDQIVYPFIRVTIDNVQVAAFIALKWCARTGQTPHRFEVIKSFQSQKQKDYDFYDMFKCSPLYIEELMRDDNISSLQFGGAVKITREFIDRNNDLYNIPGIRVSQKFGTDLSIYSTRKLERIRREQASGTLERIRRRGKTDKAIEAIEWRKICAKRKYSAVNNAQLFDSYKYKCYDPSFYRSKRRRLLDRFTNMDALKTDEEIAKLHAPELLEKLPGADDITREFYILEEIAKTANRKRLELEEDNAELKKMLEVKNEIVRAERVENFKTHKRARNFIAEEFSGVSNHNKEAVEVDMRAVWDAVETLSKYFDVEVDKRKNTIQLK